MVSRVESMLCRSGYQQRNCWSPRGFSTLTIQMKTEVGSNRGPSTAATPVSCTTVSESSSVWQQRTDYSCKSNKRWTVLNSHWIAAASRCLIHFIKLCLRHNFVLRGLLWSCISDQIFMKVVLCIRLEKFLFAVSEEVDKWSPQVTQQIHVFSQKKLWVIFHLDSTHHDHPAERCRLDFSSTWSNPSHSCLLTSATKLHK